jgi:hypothetical protein
VLTHWFPAAKYPDEKWMQAIVNDTEYVERLLFNLTEEERKEWGCKYPVVCVFTPVSMRDHY